MSTCEQCGTEIAEGREVHLPAGEGDGDALAPMAVVCPECAERETVAPGNGSEPLDLTDDESEWVETDLSRAADEADAEWTARLAAAEARAAERIPADDRWAALRAESDARWADREAGIAEWQAERRAAVEDRAERLAADAPPGDTYGREQAARILGVSPRRVSQLAADGRLEVVQDKPLRVSAESVHRLREERRSPGRDQRATVPPDPAGDVAAQIERVVGLVVAEHRKAIEAGEHLLAEVTTQRDEYRAEVERLRSEVEGERAAREAAEQAAAQKAARKWWQRG